MFQRSKWKFSRFFFVEKMFNRETDDALARGKKPKENKIERNIVCRVFVLKTKLEWIARLRKILQM